MAKKRSKNALFDTVVEGKVPEVVAEENKNAEDIVQQDECMKDCCKNPYMATEQDIQIEELKAEVSRLTAELNRLCNERNALKKQLEEKDAQVKNAASLTLQNTALREENDQYLMKISELTFDNAKMNCQLQGLSKQIEAKLPSKQNVTSSQKSINVQSRNVPYSRMPKTDIHGYESWN